MPSEAKTIDSRAALVRRKLQALEAGRNAARENKRRARSVEQVSTLAPALGQVTSALAAAVLGYELCARRAREANVAVAATNAATSVKSLLEAMVAEAATYGVDAKPRARLGDRMHWEWLASTGMVVDGSADARLLDECARILGSVIGVDVSPLGDEYASKVRLASAEASSLAAAVTPRPGFAFPAIA